MDVYHASAAHPELQAWTGTVGRAHWTAVALVSVSSTTQGQKVIIESLYAAADRALHVAKQLGRDQVEYAVPDPSALTAPPV